LIKTWVKNPTPYASIHQGSAGYDNIYSLSISNPGERTVTATTQLHSFSNKNKALCCKQYTKVSQSIIICLLQHYTTRNPTFFLSISYQTRVLELKS